MKQPGKYDYKYHFNNRFGESTKLLGNGSTEPVQTGWILPLNETTLDIRNNTENCNVIYKEK